MVTSYKNRTSNRKQYIISQDVSQNCLDIICGVAQGSILDPFLFLIYARDLFKGSNQFTFVDDKNVLLSHKNIDTLFASIYVELTMSQRGLSQTNNLWMLAIIFS